MAGTSLASGIPTLKLTYPTDLTENGLSFDDAAARLQQYLDQIGINVTLQPAVYPGRPGVLPGRHRSARALVLGP